MRDKFHNLMQYRFVSVNPTFMNCCTLSGMNFVQKLPAALFPFFAQKTVAKTTHIIFSNWGYFRSLAVFLPGDGEVKARCTRVCGDARSQMNTVALMLAKWKFLGPRHPSALVPSHSGMAPCSAQGWVPPEYMSNICFK